MFSRSRIWNKIFLLYLVSLKLRSCTVVYTFYVLREFFKLLYSNREHFMFVVNKVIMLAQLIWEVRIIIRYFHHYHSIFSSI